MLFFFLFNLYSKNNRNSTSSKFAKSIITRLTNKQNLGGTRLIRGYPEVEELTKKSKASTTKKASVTVEDLDSGNVSSSDEESPIKEEERQQMEDNEAEDYDNENSEEEVRKIDHLMFVIHG